MKAALLTASIVRRERRMFCNGLTPSTGSGQAVQAEAFNRARPTRTRLSLQSLAARRFCTCSEPSLTTSAFAGTNQHLALNFSLCRICTRHYLFTLATISIWRVQQTHDAHFY
jgi:hypothetical protein